MKTSQLLAWGVACASLFSLAVPGRCAEPPAAAAPHPFAMCSNGNFLTNPTYPPAFLDAGARMVRVDFTFGNVRPKPGDDPAEWNWKALDAARKIRAANRPLEFLPLLGYGANWAADPKFDPGKATHSAPQRGADIQPPTDPKNLYGHYVFETVKRFKDLGPYWESWNEPDLPGYAFFKGNGRDFFAYQKACYLAAKAADPNGKVLFAAMCFANVEGYLNAHDLVRLSPEPPKTCFFEEYLMECAKDPDAKKNHYYFDVMNQHTYSRASDAYDYIKVDQKLMADYMGDQAKSTPIWITEMGSTDKPSLFGLTPDEYCDYILQSYAWGKLAGVECFFHFQLDNSNGHGLYTGMLGEPKPVLTTYRDVLAKQFADVVSINQIHGHAGVGFLEKNSPFKPTWKTGYNAFEFKTATGRRLLMAFADTAKPVTIHLPARAAKATLIDRHNQRSEITARPAPDGSAYEIQLEGATNLAGWPSGDSAAAKAMGEAEHLVGGSTIVIVEDVPTK